MNVTWGSPLNICTDVALLANAPEQVLFIGPRIVSGTATPGADVSTSSVSSPASQPGTGQVTHHSATITAEGAEAVASPAAPRVSTVIESA